MALTAELYGRVGGFTADPIHDDDIELQDRILALATNGTYNTKMVVFTSLRRSKDMGLFGTVRWYLQDHH
jgi:hypothetical protein